MNILMATNTYLPMVGGVALSVHQFAEAYRAKGHDVLIVAPTFEDAEDEEPGVVRVPAIQNFNGSDFSVRVPAPGLLSRAIEDFAPHIVHSHHPFLLGDTALRISASHGLPLVFTHHTMYERYTHYVPGDSPVMKRFAVRLATQYANLAQQVIAPSESIAQLLAERGVETPIESIPTGVNVERFAHGQGARMRRELGIDEDAIVVGHVGRLAPEKNLPALAEAAAQAIEPYPRAVFLVVGEGPSAHDVRQVFAERGLDRRLYLAGKRTGKNLVDCYHAMNLFAFASLTETQGMVLAEAMGAGLPVAALDAPGVREIVEDGRNGRLVTADTELTLAGAIESLITAGSDEMESLRDRARATAAAFSIERCAERALAVYKRVLDAEEPTRAGSPDAWEKLLKRIETEWTLWSSRAGAAIDTLGTSGPV